MITSWGTGVAWVNKKIMMHLVYPFSFIHQNATSILVESHQRFCLHVTLKVLVTTTDALGYFF